MADPVLANLRQSKFTDPRELRAQAARLTATATAIENGTWEAVVDGVVTPAQLAEKLDCSVQSANNYLRALYDVRLVNRERVVVPGGGRKFAYALALDETGGDA